MAQYTSAWWQHRFSQVKDLMDVRPIPSIEDSPDQGDEELLDLRDDQILHDRNTSQVNIYLDY
jgi:hypothetical protein